MSNRTPNHFRCFCGAVDEKTFANHASQSYCGSCKSAPRLVVETSTEADVSDTPVPKKSKKGAAK